MMTYEPRTYRTRMARPGLVGFQVAVRETDLWVLAGRDLTPEVGRWCSRSGGSWRPISPPTRNLSPP